MRVLLSFLLALSGFGLTKGISQDELVETGMKPVSPQVLWEAMPGKLEEWKILKSTGETALGSWLESQAVREYERVELPPEEGKPKSKPAPPMWTRILVTDTGKHPEALAGFDDFSTDTPSEDERIEKLRIQSWPTIAMTYEDGLIVANLMVAERFLIEIVLKNQPKRNLRAWCRSMDFGALAKVPDTELIPLPAEVAIVRLDQLKPRRNKGYMMGTTSEAELEAELEAEEKYLEEVLGYIPEIEEEEGGLEDVEE